MYAYIHLEKSYIIFLDIKKSHKFVSQLKKIDNFADFFDNFNVSKEIKDDDCYSLTYKPNSDLSEDSIINLIHKIILLCKKYNYELNLKIKIFDDGQFLLYLIVIK